MLSNWLDSMKIIEGVNLKKSGKVSQMQIFKAIFLSFLALHGIWVFEEEFSAWLLVSNKVLVLQLPSFCVFSCNCSTGSLEVVEDSKIFSKRKRKRQNRGFHLPSINWDLFTPRFSRNGISTKRYENFFEEPKGNG